MIRKTFFLALSALAVLGFSTSAWTDVGWEVLKTLNLEDVPLDLASTVDGKLSFILLEGGDILVYTNEGELRDRIKMDVRADRIEVSPAGDKLYLTNRKEQVVRIVGLEFTQSIDISGSPTKGPAAAPVVIAVYDDFQ